MKKEKILEYIATPLITLIILVFIFIVKQIYPFGNGTICTVDMPIGYVPAYTQLWDILHGEGNIFYNFNLGSGSNVYGALISNGLFSPINWIIGLFSRDNIAGAMSILLVIKMMLMALTSYIFFNNVFFKVDKKWKMIASLMYTFNGYTLLMYSNIIWFDSLALFPLITLAFKKILDEGKCLWYIILLSINLMISFYISWLMLMIIIFGGTLALFTYVEKSRRKEVATKILISTIIALMISFVSFLPAFMQSMHSYRISDGVSETSSSGDFMWFKLFHIILSGTLLFFNIIYFMNYKMDKKSKGMYGGLLFLTILPIFVDSVNKMWHTGSYSNFPYRYGFITIFIMICVMLRYMENIECNIKGYSNKTKQLLIISSIAFAFIIGICIKIYFIYGDITKGFGVNQIQQDLYVLILWFTGLELFITYCLTNLENKKLSKNIIFLLVLFQIVIHSCIFIERLKINDIKSTEEINRFNVYNISKNLQMEEYKSLFKFKDETHLLMINYPYITKTPAMTTWLHIISTEQRLVAEKLGYSTYKTVVRDQGGTLATDVILGNKYTLSKEKFDDDIYTEIEEYNNIKLYELNIKNNFTKIYNKSNDISTIVNKTENLFDIQNDLIKKLYNTEENIFELENKKDIEKNVVEYNFSIKDKTNIYLDVDKYTDLSYIKEIYINNEKKNILSLYGINIEQYPEKETTNGILNLGIFENSQINIKLILSDEITEDTINSIQIAKLNVNKLKELSEKNIFEENININANKFTVKLNNNSENSALFIPIIYDDGWKCKINNKEVIINRALDGFMSVDLEQGENNIQFVFIPSYFEIAEKITIITLIIFILYEILNKCLNIDKKINLLYKIGYVLYLLVFVVFLYKIYILPIINDIKMLI